MMNQVEKNYKLFTQNSDGGITEREITQEELGRIFFHEGNREWDNVHMALPDPVWERIYEDGYLLYEGYTVDHSALGVLPLCQYLCTPSKRPYLLRFLGLRLCTPLLRTPNLMAKNG